MSPFGDRLSHSSGEVHGRGDMVVGIGRIDPVAGTTGTTQFVPSVGARHRNLYCPLTGTVLTRRGFQLRGSWLNHLDLEPVCGRSQENSAFAGARSSVHHCLVPGQYSGGRPTRECRATTHRLVLCQRIFYFAHAVGYGVDLQYRPSGWRNHWNYRLGFVCWVRAG